MRVNEENWESGYPDRDSQTFEILLFAAVAEQVGANRLSIELEGTATVGRLADRLIAENPGLMTLLKTCRWAVDRVFVDDQQVVTGGQEIAVIPPVSGG